MAKLKWMKPDRLNFLKKLDAELYNRCRRPDLHDDLNTAYGCKNPEHYIQIKSKVVLTPRKVKYIEYTNPSTCKPILDKVNDPVYFKHLEVSKNIVVYPTVEWQFEQDTDFKGYVSDYDLIRERNRLNWIQADKLESIYAYQSEYEVRHHVHDRLPIRGSFNGIARDVYYDALAVYKVVGFGIDVRFKPFALVEFNATGNRMFIDISNVLNTFSVNKRRKIIRYANNGKIDPTLDCAIYSAVRQYLS